MADDVARRDVLKARRLDPLLVLRARAGRVHRVILRTKAEVVKQERQS